MGLTERDTYIAGNTQQDLNSGKAFFQKVKEKKAVFMYLFTVFLCVCVATIKKRKLFLGGKVVQK